MSLEEYGVGIIKDVMLPCRDGVRLATDIYRPTKNGEIVAEKFPTILERMPYNKERNEIKTKADYFVKRGYVLVVQDCRGRFKSEGEFCMATNDPTDGFDAIEWIAKQSWSNGKIGTMGTSYAGWVQSGLALLNPPHLTAMFPNQSIFNAGLHSTRHAGALEMRIFAWAYWMASVSKDAAQNSAIAKNLFDTRFDELITQWPLKKGETPLRLVPTYEKFAFDILTHSDFDEFWRKTGIGWRGDVEDYIDDHADVPMYYSGGWFDSYPRSTTELYSTMSKAKTSPVKLIMGHWTHGDAGALARTYSGDVDFGSYAKIDYNALRLRWFDQTLKETDTSIFDEPPIKIFVMGGGDGHRNREGRMNHGGRWRYEKEWPLARTDYKKFYLCTGGFLNTNPSDKEDSSTSYVYDPNNPVPSIGGNHSAIYTILPPPKGYDKLENLSDYEKFWFLRTSIVKAGAYNQVETPSVYGANPPYLPLSARHDVLVFQTPALEKDIEVTGPLKIVLWASSSAVDTDFTAKLIDVYPPNEDYPNGYAMNLSDSIIRARYRDSFETQKLMEPGETYQFIIQPYPTSNLFKKGHRIRLDISSSNWPRFDINPNTGEPLGLSTRTEKATNTIYHDEAHPSNIVLPIIPRARL